jgi:Bacterial TniB protein
MTLDHLLPNTAQAALGSNAERIAYIEANRWIPYEKATEVLAVMEDLLVRPIDVRPAGLLVVAGSNNGKSSLLRRFVALHPADDNPNGPNILAKAILIETPPTPGEGQLYDEILMAFSKKPRPNQSPDMKRPVVVELLREIGVRILVLDEINNILAGSVAKQRAFLNTLKYLSNKLGLSIIASGTPEALSVVKTDPAIDNRLRKEYLPLWGCDMNYRQLLASFEQMLPLKEPSSISRRELAALVHSRTDGTIGSTSTLLAEAAKWAIRNGQETIDERALKECSFKSKAEERSLLG